jgi:hypothetical protein
MVIALVFLSKAGLVAMFIHQTGDILLGNPGDPMI